MLDPQSRRQMFPTLDSCTYLNTAAEGIPSLAVKDALNQYFADHQLGMDGRVQHMQQLEALKANVAALYGLTAEEIGICSCSSEAYNLAAAALRMKEGDEVVVSDLDFPAGVTPWLQESSPATVRLWKSRDGRLAMDDLRPLLSGKTRLVQVSLVSFLNGFRINFAELIDLVRRHSAALVSVDVTQALGRIPLGLTGADLIVSSTHKWILGTHGGGLVGVPAGRARELTSTAGGWFHIDDAFGPSRFERAVSKPGAASYSVGMPNCAAIYANRAALDYIRSVGVDAIDQYARPLVAACLAGLKRLPVELLSPGSPEALAGIIGFRHPKAEAIHRHLHEKNVHLMHHAGRLRVSIHGYNTASDVETFVRGLKEAIDAC